MKVKIPKKLTKAEENAMFAEIDKQIVAREEQYDMDYDAAIAWVMHKYYGFDLLQLLTLRRILAEETHRLRGTFLARGTYAQRAALKELGYDVEDLAKQDTERNK